MKILKNFTVEMFMFAALIGVIVFVLVTAIANEGDVHGPSSGIATPSVHPRACWTEPKPGTNYPDELICGDVSLAPVNAYNFHDYPGDK